MENRHGEQNDSDGISGVSVLAAGTLVPRLELISSPGIASFVGGEAIPVSPPPAKFVEPCRSELGHVKLLEAECDAHTTCRLSAIVCEGLSFFSFLKKRPRIFFKIWNGTPKSWNIHKFLEHAKRRHERCNMQHEKWTCTVSCGEIRSPGGVQPVCPAA